MIAPFLAAGKEGGGTVRQSVASPLLACIFRWVWPGAQEEATAELEKCH